MALTADHVPGDSGHTSDHNAIDQAIIDLIADSTTIASSYVPATILTGPGIDPTGTTDSYAGLQSLISTAATGANLILPPGQYKISSTLVINKTLSFGGQYATRWTNDNSDPVAGTELIYTGITGDAFRVETTAVTNTRVSPFLHNFLIRGNKNIGGAASGGGLKFLGPAGVAGTAISGFVIEDVHICDAKGIGLTVIGDVYEGRFVGITTTDCVGDGINITAGGGGGFPGECLWEDIHSHDNGGDGIDCEAGAGWSWIRVSASRNTGAGFRMIGCQFRVWDLQLESNLGSEVVSLDSIISGIIVGLNIDYLEPAYVGSGVSVKNNSRQVTLINAEFGGTATTWDILTDATTDNFLGINCRQSAANKVSFGGAGDLLISGAVHYGISEFGPRSTDTKAVVYRNLPGQTEDIFQHVDAAGATVYSRITANGGFRCRDDIIAQIGLGPQTQIGAMGPADEPGIAMGADVVIYREKANVAKQQAGDSFKTGQDTTANRPSAATHGMGAHFFDTTTTKPIYSDSVTWKTIQSEEDANATFAPYNVTNAKNPLTGWFHTNQYGTVGNGAATSAADTDALQRCVTDACAANGKVYIPQPISSYVLSDTITIQPATGQNVQLSIEAEGSVSQFLWGGADNKSMFYAVGWNKSHVTGVRVRLNGKTGITVWDIDNTTALPFASNIDWRDCQVTGDTANTSCVGWRMGHSHDGTGMNISALSWTNCFVNLDGVGGGNHLGWVWENSNCLGYTWTNCGGGNLAKCWTGTPTAGSSGDNGGGGMTWVGPLVTGNAIDYEFANAGNYAIFGGRHEVGAQFMKITGGGGTNAYNVTVNTIIQGYTLSGGMLCDLNSAGTYIFDGSAIGAMTGDLPITALKVTTGAGASSLLSLNGLSVQAPDPFWTAAGPGTLRVHAIGMARINSSGQITAMHRSRVPAPFSVDTAGASVFNVDEFYVARFPGNIAIGGASNLYSGASAPNDANGSNGDYYFRQDTPGTPNQQLYVKSAGTWVETNAAETAARIAADDAALVAANAAYPVQANHGATAGTARPTGTLVEWTGSVTPTNAVSGDRWYDTTNELWKRHNGTSFQSEGSLTYAPKASPQFSGGIGLGEAPTVRIPVNLQSALTPAPVGTSNKVGQFFSTIATGDWSTGTGTDPTFGFGLNVFAVTGSAANDGKGGTFSNLIEWDVQAASGTITTVIGLQAEASFYGATAGATVTNMQSMRVAAPKRKNGAVAGTATNAYGLFIETVDGAAVGATAAFSLFVEGGPSRLQGSLSVNNNINSYNGTLDLRPNNSLAKPYVSMTDIAGGGNITATLGAAGSVFNVFSSSDALKLQVSDTGVGLNGNSAVAKAAAIAAPTAPGTVYSQAEAESMKTAVDAIRTALTNIGITA